MCAYSGGAVQLVADFIVHLVEGQLGGDAQGYIALFYRPRLEREPITYWPAAYKRDAEYRCSRAFDLFSRPCRVRDLALHIYSHAPGGPPRALLVATGISAFASPQGGLVDTYVEGLGSLARVVILLPQEIAQQ